MKKFATDSRSNPCASKSISPLNLSKQRQSSLITASVLPQSVTQSQGSPSNGKANRSNEKKVSFTSSSSSQYSIDASSCPSRSTCTIITDRTSTINSERPIRKALMRRIPSAARSSSKTTSKVTIGNEPSTDSISLHAQTTFASNDEETLHRRYRAILEQMDRLCIRYPNKSEEETRRISSEIIDNWKVHRSSIEEFWLVRLDTRKRQAILTIVRNNTQQIMKKSVASDQAIEQLSLSRHLDRLEQRLLTNNGRCFWDLCLNRHK